MKGENELFSQLRKAGDSILPALLWKHSFRAILGVPIADKSIK